jgi:predicted PurR-regulated permease PerM
MLEFRRLSERNISWIALTSAIALGAAVCVLIAWPFLSAIVWSITLAVLFAPLDAAIGKRLKSRGLAAGATVVITACIAVVPTILIVGTLLNEAVRSAAIIAPKIDTSSWADAVGRHPWLTPALEWVREKIDLADLMRAPTAALAGWSGSVVRGSFSGMLNLFLTFYFLFYLLRDRDTIVETMRLYLPLSNAEFSRVSRRAVDTIFATVFGTVAVAALQGSLGGLMFWWLGLPAPVFWGVLMALLAVIPVLGAFVIWAPAAALLALSGNYQSAIVLTIWGTVVVGLVDNVIYPILVGNRLRMHTLLSFVAVVGGLVVLGAPGIVLGPLVVAMTLTLAEIWRGRGEPVETAAP